MISSKDWTRYITRLKAISEKAAEEMQAYVDQFGFGNTSAVIHQAYALSTKYGEAASAAACDMYDAVATGAKVNVPPAAPAETASYSDVAKAVNGALKQNAEGQVPQIVGRKVKQAGADTTLKNAIRDGAEFAWVPHGDTCAFCITLASRGWQRASKKALKGGHAEHIHSNCDCEYAVRFSDSDGVRGYDPDRYKRIYYDHGGDINSIRREQYQENKEKINAQKRAAYSKLAVIPEEKFTEYALNPEKDINKAKAFKKALGYDRTNYQGLREQIRRSVNIDMCVEKGNNGYGVLFEQIMKITGVNGKTANVCTGWIRKNGEKRLTLTSLYVTKRKRQL